jgi:hypothetical protein
MAVGEIADVAALVRHTTVSKTINVFLMIVSPRRWFAGTCRDRTGELATIRVTWCNNL